MKVVMLSALRTGRLYPPGNIPGTHFCYRLSRPQGHSAARRITSMKNSNDTIGNRTRDLPTYSVVPQTTAPPRTPNFRHKSQENQVSRCSIKIRCRPKNTLKTQVSWDLTTCRLEISYRRFEALCTFKTPITI